MKGTPISLISLFLKDIKSVAALTPQWLQDACGILLTQLIAKPTNGVINLIQGVLDIGRNATTGGDMESDKKKCSVVTSIIATPHFHKGKYQELEKYFAEVCSQLLVLIGVSKVGMQYHW